MRIKAAAAHVIKDRLAAAQRDRRIDEKRPRQDRGVFIDPRRRCVDHFIARIRKSQMVDDQVFNVQHIQHPGLKLQPLPADLIDRHRLRGQLAVARDDPPVLGDETVQSITVLAVKAGLFEKLLIDAQLGGRVPENVLDEMERIPVAGFFVQNRKQAINACVFFDEIHHRRAVKIINLFLRRPRLNDLAVHHPQIHHHQDQQHRAQAQRGELAV
ncbi:MAG: hypothetical protein BWY83_00300 [bacterium ADurb.Bin478]|nr:MAG: hypothetical protein BWY83_00300 [bacterium ADurb.Bin478]